MTLALYRKYRPRTFSEIIGQDHVTQPLSQALRSGNINHAYLFSGPRGCGKTSSARILARSLNCAKGPTPEPCGECDSCRALAPDGAGSIDVIEIDAASHGGVDDARDLRERAFFAPVSSRYKIYVIDEAHMVSSAGFNALLKLVEEPPDYVKFVFATTEPEKVLATIKSRTHHYPFRLIAPNVLRPYLEQLATSEGVKVEPAVFPLVVRAGGGSARDSLSVLDQLIAGAGTEGVTYARAVALLGVTDVALIDEVCDALAAGDGAAVYSTINRVAEAGHDARRFAGDLLERLRNLIVLQQVPDAIEKGLLDGADDELARMRAQSERFGAATLSRMADIVHTGLIDMRGTTAPRLVLELMAARMLLPGAEGSMAALLARMERMERRITLADTDNPQTEVVRPAAPLPATNAPTGAAAARAALAAATAARPGDSAPSVDAVSGVVVPAPPARTPVAPAVVEPVVEPVAEAAAPPPPPPPPSSEPVPAGAVDAAGIRRIWDEVLSLVRRQNPRVAAFVREATVREVTGDTLVLVFQHAFHADALSASPALLQEALYEVLGGRWRISCEVVGQASPSADRRITPAAPASRAGSGSAPETAAGSCPGGPVPPASPSGSTGSAPSGAGPASPTASASAALGPTGFAGPQAGGDSMPAVRASGSIPAAQTGGGSVPAAHAGGGSFPAAQGGGSVAVMTAPVAVMSQQAGVSAVGSRPDAVARIQPQVEEDWPETATLGGAGADGGIPPTPAAAPAAVAPTPAPAPVANSMPARSQSPAAAAVERANAMAATTAARGGGRSNGGRAAAGRNVTPPAGRKTDDSWAGTGDEPPWDPEFDGPVGRPDAGRAAADVQYVGFDPGDEPIDDETDPANRQTTEQQAFDLLREALGAEKIGES
jgi:DNA polymerase III subunit gamma/tau